MSTTLYVRTGDLVMAGAKVTFERHSDEDTDGPFHHPVAFLVTPLGVELAFDCSDDLTSLHTDVKPHDKRRVYVDALCDLGVPFTVS